MTTKRGLITDSFKVVKKKKRGRKPEKSQTPPAPETEIVADPVQQEALQTLKDFDLDWRFGPCTGISRLQRWERAELHGLSPPEEIRELLLKAPADSEYSRSLWNEYPL